MTRRIILFFLLLSLITVLFTSCQTATTPTETPTLTPTIVPTANTTAIPTAEPSVTPAEPPTSAVVTFIINLEEAGYDVSYTYKIGESIPASDVPKLKNFGMNGFECWTIDERGLIPCNPENYTVTEDVTFYANWSSRADPYYNTITSKEKNDGGIYSLPQGKVIFYGSTHIARWSSLQKDLKSVGALNHSLSGALTDDLLRHLDRLVLRYNPAVVFLELNDYDIVSYSNEEFIEKTMLLYNSIREALPDTLIVFISFMPLPARTHYWMASTRLQDINAHIKEFCDSTNNCEYIDIWDDIMKITNIYLMGNLRNYFEDSYKFNSAGRMKYTSILKKNVLNILEK